MTQTEATTAQSPLFELNNVSIHFGHLQALQHIQLQIWPGEQIALIGSNGSGKSTLLRVLNGLLAPSSGHLSRPPQHQQALLFQRPQMLRASAQTNVALGLWLNGTPWRKAMQHALTALAHVDLSDIAQQNAKTLSMGQQQRLAFARAFARQPKVLLLDEPTASLDPTAKREVETLMEKFTTLDLGLPTSKANCMVFSSHSLNQVKRLANRVIYLEQGKVLADLSSTAFFNEPLPTAVELFIQGDFP